MKRSVWGGLIGLIGFGLIGFAVFANRFGFDKENDWENGRVSVLVAGGILILIAILKSNHGKAVLAWMQKSISKCVHLILEWPTLQKSVERVQKQLISWKVAWNHSPCVRWYHEKIKDPLHNFGEQIQKFRLVRYFSGSQERKAALVAILCSLGVIAVYTWYISAGLWTEWPTSSTYYSRLADAFLQKQASLLEEPDPALSQLEDPYDVASREGIPYPWDIVFYHGKYYLYWGPLPAFLFSAIRIFYSSALGDQYLVYAFLAGEFLVSVLFLLQLRKRFFPNLGAVWVVPGILLAGLANPLLMMLTAAAVYEAAVAGGQFFLVLGMYLGFAHTTETSRQKYGRLVAISLCLACSAACRVSLLPALVFLFAMVAWNILRRSSAKKGGNLMAVGLLGLPFAAGLLGLGWYNQVRFGSWFEFGLRYQLTTANLNTLQGLTFTWANLPANLYTYLLNPFQVSSVFPYIIPLWGNRFIILPIKSPTYCYFAGPVSGLLLNMPYVFLAFLPLTVLLRQEISQLRDAFALKNKPNSPPGHDLLLWTILLFSGVATLTFTPVLLFFAVTMRYQADVVPTLVLLATLGSWIGGASLIKQPGQKKWFFLLVVALMVFSVAISILLTLHHLEYRLSKDNPALFSVFVEWLNIP